MPQSDPTAIVNAQLRIIKSASGRAIAEYESGDNSLEHG